MFVTCSLIVELVEELLALCSMNRWLLGCGIWRRGFVVVLTCKRVDILYKRAEGSR